MKISAIEAFREDLRVFERALERLNKSCCFQGIHLSHCHTIMEIGKVNALSSKELAEKLNLEKSTISRTIDKLVKQGLVDRSIPDHDRRSLEISLSKKGKDFYKKANNILNSHFSDLFGRFDNSELRNFMITFHKLAHWI